MKQLKLSTIITITMVLFAIVAISGCTTGSPTVTPTAAPTAAPTATPATVLSITGKVANPLQLTNAALAAYPNQTITTAGKNNSTLTFTGVSLNKLLDDAKVNSDAVSAKFIGSDGYAQSINLTDIRAANNSLMAYKADGTLENVVPGLPQKVWVGNLTTIEIS